MRGEFHIHTKSSDGVMTVEEILDYVNNTEDYISITDHDVFDSSIEAYHLNETKKYKVKCLVGVEISSTFADDTVHVLGYFKDDKNLEELKELTKKIRINRIDRLYKIAERLKEYFDIDLDLTDLLKRSSITRGSIAREIIKQGYNYTTEELFASVIGHGCKAYIPASKISVKEAIDAIHRAKGKAVLAHPTLLKKAKLEDLMKFDFDGIEAKYPRNKDGEEEMYRKVAKENSLFISGGCDFHSFNDSQHADLLTVYLENEDLEMFLNGVLR